MPGAKQRDTVPIEVHGHRGCLPRRRVTLLARRAPRHCDRGMVGRGNATRGLTCLAGPQAHCDKVWWDNERKHTTAHCDLSRTSGDFRV